jgi:CheY-like chemotaxis protein
MTSVLVIDDNVEIRDLLCLLLASLGYQTRVAQDGVQGLKSYRDEPADVVLLDMFMPEKDGLETLRDLLQFDPNIRVIAMTGGGTFKNVGILKPALLLGARRLLFKPVTSAELRTAIEETMAAPR